jgi:ATP-dependent Lon protease
VKTVFLPAENEKDLRDERDVPREVVDAIEFVFLTHADELLDAALAHIRPTAPARKPASKPTVKSASKKVRSPAPSRKAA